MKINVVPSFKAQIEAAARSLKDAPGDHVVIEGADNAMLVKLTSPMGDQMRAERRVLFPQTIEGVLYLVCIAKRRSPVRRSAETVKDVS